MWTLRSLRGSWNQVLLSSPSTVKFPCQPVSCFCFLASLHSPSLHRSSDWLSWGTEWQGDQSSTTCLFTSRFLIIPLHLTLHTEVHGIVDYRCGNSVVLCYPMESIYLALDKYSHTSLILIQSYHTVLQHQYGYAILQLYWIRYHKHR